jgi:hypothetical protein
MNGNELWRNNRFSFVLEAIRYKDQGRFTVGQLAEIALAATRRIPPMLRGDINRELAKKEPRDAAKAPD